MSHAGAAKFSSQHAHTCWCQKPHIHPYMVIVDAPLIALSRAITGGPAESPRMPMNARYACRMYGLLRCCRGPPQGPMPRACLIRCQRGVKVGYAFVSTSAGLNQSKEARVMRSGYLLKQTRSTPVSLAAVLSSVRLLPSHGCPYSLD